MKSQIKDIVISIFAVIGFTAIVMGFNNPAEPQQVTYATPESHVWELRFADSNNSENYGIPYLFNKVTGEVRKYNETKTNIRTDGYLHNNYNHRYVTMNEIKNRSNHF